MPSTNKNSVERINRVIGNYLAVYAWTHGADCIRVSSGFLKMIRGIARFRGASYRRLRDDIKCWFPYCYPDWKTRPAGLTRKKPDKSLRWLYLSRTELRKDGRLDRDLTFIRFRPDRGVDLSEDGLRTHLKMVASGAIGPTDSCVAISD
jgi:hypothetical protein